MFERVTVTGGGTAEIVELLEPDTVTVVVEPLAVTVTVGWGV